MSPSADYRVRDFLDAAGALRRAIDGELAELTRLREDHERRIAELSSRRDEAVKALARALLPRLELEGCRRAGTLAGFKDLQAPADPIAEVDEERRALNARVAMLEGDPRWRDRVKLRAPGTGELTRQAEELERLRAPAAELLQRAAHPRLERLLAEGYGTPAYRVEWWRLSYYADWEAGDEVVERFPGRADFAAIREELLAAQTSLAILDTQLKDVRAAIAEGEVVEKDHDSSAHRLANLEPLVLEDWRERLAAHLSAGGVAVLAGRTLPADVALLVKTVLGLEKKLEYLAQLATTALDQPFLELRTQREKLEHDAVKYARPKRAGTIFSAEEFQHRFRDRSAGWARRRQRYDRTVQAIAGFEDYGRARFADDFLWWDLMTDGRLDGDFVPEVAQHRADHPGYRWERTHDDTWAAAAAAGRDARSEDARLDAS